MLELTIYLVVGVFSGLIAGLLGAGGGAVIIPPLVWIFNLHDVSAEIMMHIAIGTSLATIVVTSLSSIRAHHKRGGVLWQVFLRLTPGIIVGALLGATVADALHSETLQIVFGGFLLLLSIQMSFGFKPSPNRALPNMSGMFVAGAITGVVSAIVGIGGAALTVPFLVWCNTPMRNAVATSAACGLPIAMAGAAGYMSLGWSDPALPAWSIGYVYLPALSGIALASTLVAPLGARIAHTLPTEILKKVFATLLAIISIKMLLG